MLIVGNHQLLADAVTQFTSITICKSIYKTLFLDFE